MLRWFLVVLLLASSNGLADEASRKDPIDDHMRSAIDRDPSTAGMVRAYSDASVQWDKRMNSAYRSLKKQMSPDEWQSLAAAQKAWVAYRDAQVKSLELTYSRMNGSMSGTRVSCQRSDNYPGPRAFPGVSGRDSFGALTSSDQISNRREQPAK